MLDLLLNTKINKEGEEEEGEENRPFLLEVSGRRMYSSFSIIFDTLVGPSYDYDTKITRVKLHTHTHTPKTCLSTFLQVLMTSSFPETKLTNDNMASVRTADADVAVEVAVGVLGLMGAVYDPWCRDQRVSVYVNMSRTAGVLILIVGALVVFLWALIESHSNEAEVNGVVTGWHGHTHTSYMLIKPSVNKTSFTFHSLKSSKRLFAV